MALFGFNSSRYEMLMSVCFTCLCNSTHRKLRCIGNFIRYVYQLVNDIRARRGNACVRICSATQQSSRTEPHFRHRVPYRFGWIATRDCLSWHWISWRLLPLKPMLNDYSRCVVIWQHWNGTVLTCPFVVCRRIFLKLKRHILHWTQCTVNWSVTCFWYYRTAEDTLHRLHFDFYWLTYLVSSLVVPQ